MAITGLPVSRIVNVTVNLSPPAAQGQDIDTCIVLGTSDVIDVDQRYRSYSSIDAVATDFGTTVEEYLSAVLWFEQRPQPVNLLIGRWADADTSGILVSGPVSTTNKLVSTWTAITTGGFLITMRSVPLAIGPCNFSAITNLNGVASVIQTAMASALSGSTCVWDSTYGVFRFTAGGAAGANSTISFISPSAAVGFASFTGQPSPADTLTINGTAITFVSALTTGNQVLIGASLAATLVNLLAFLNASSDTQLVKFTYSVVASKLYLVAVTAGTAGNSLTLAKSATNITLSGATLAGAVATDISTQLAATSTSSGVYAAQGMAAETALAAVTLFDANYGQIWYGLTVPSASDADSEDIANYIEASTNKHYFGVTSQEGGIITSGNTSNVAYSLKQLGINHACVQYSSENAYAAMSYLARILTTNWAANNSTITLKFKQEPGIVAETLTTTQADAAEATNANVFVNYNNDTAIIEQGVSCSGQYTDSIVGLDWLAVELQTNLYNALYQSPTKIPMTDAGNHILATVIANTMNEAVNNGLVAPGVWNQGGFGALKQGDYLKTGYYIFQPLVASMTASQRAARRSVPFQIAVNLAGAIHSVSAAILVNS